MHSQSWLKDRLRALVPGSLLRVRQARRNRKRSIYCSMLTALTGGSVLTGPFAGMKYSTSAAGSALGPKILGTYESELHHLVERIKEIPFDGVINVGAGEGYYAVGLLKSCPKLNCYAYEGDIRAQSLIRELATANEVVDRLSVGGFCTPVELTRGLDSLNSPLVVLDVEGAEGDLLDPSTCPSTRKASILVEVHEYLRPGVTTALLERYAASHDIQRVPTVSSTELTLPMVSGLTRKQVSLLADEMRPARMEWFWMTPKPN
jgi:hypothetical protein